MRTSSEADRQGLALVVLAGLLAAVALPGVLLAQQAGTTLTRPPQSAEGSSPPTAGSSPLLPSQLIGRGMQGQGAANRLDAFSAIWQRPSAPAFSGFPSFPSRLPGYGNYPLPVDPSAMGLPSLVGPLAPAMPEPPGWPAWVRARDREPIPFGPTVGLLSGANGQVWRRGAESDPFVPLMVHEEFASLSTGSEVEMRTGGTFEVLLHKTTRVQTRGVTSLRVGKLDAENVQIAFDKLTWLRLTSIGRTCIFTMPDGSTLQFGGPALSEDPAPGFGGLMGLFGMPSPTPSLLPPSVELRRIDEPSWFGGRATITNLGGSEVVWRHAFGVTRIGPSQRVTFFLSPPDATVKADLNVGTARVEELGDRITCHGVSATTVQWCGASIQVPAGGSVTFESLGGDFQKAAVGTNISRSPATSGAAGSGG